MLGIFKLNISPLSISEPLGDEAEINRSAGRSPGSGRRQLMHQIPPRCLMFQGYDRTVYKTSSVIYTVIISRGALNFRFTCSFNSVPWFRLIPEYFLGESRSGAAPCPGAARPPRSRGCIAVTPQPSPPSRPDAGGRRRGPGSGDSTGATDPPRSCLPPATPRKLDYVSSRAPFSPQNNWVRWRVLQATQIHQAGSCVG